MDPYSILDIPRDATTDQIKRAHRKLAQKWHPDLNTSSEAKAKFTEIQQAYESLIHGKPFKASSRPNTQQSPRQSAYTPRSEPPRQQSSANRAERAKKRQTAMVKKQKAQTEVNAKRARDRQQYSKDMQANRERTTQTVTNLRVSSAKIVEQTQRSASSRLEAARTAYARLVQSINEERDKTIQKTVVVRDQMITEALRAKDERERSLVTWNTTSDRTHQTDLQRIERQFQADLAAAG
ncbi:MAG TPA: J domain-containing protein [Candidatus Microsaccharimonas sp.]|jgi:DnaJ-class molecular chaperone